MRSELDNEEFTDLRGDVYLGDCKACGHWLHFLDGDDDNCWMVCDSCFSMTCTTDSQEKTLTEWSKKNA